MHFIIAHYMWLNNENYFNGEPQLQNFFKHIYKIKIYITFLAFSRPKKKRIASFGYRSERILKIN